eukprot:6194530-Pleurochrysis_carterae.AAC.4
MSGVKQSIWRANWQITTSSPAHRRRFWIPTYLHGGSCRWFPQRNLHGTLPYTAAGSARPAMHQLLFMLRYWDTSAKADLADGDDAAAGDE